MKNRGFPVHFKIKSFVPFYRLLPTMIAVQSLIQQPPAAFAQGQVVLNNRIAGLVDARVTFADGSGVAAGYTAQLFGGPVGEPFTALLPATTFRTSSAAAQGYVNGVVVVVHGVPHAGEVTVSRRGLQGALGPA